MEAKKVGAPACAELPGGCRVEELFQMLSKSHTLDILHLFIRQEEGPLRFVEIQDRLKMSPNTLSNRLKELTGAGFLTRTAYNEIPPRVDYAATAKAFALCQVFEALKAWAQEHDLQPAGPQTAPDMEPVVA